MKNFGVLLAAAVVLRLLGCRIRARKAAERPHRH